MRCSLVYVLTSFSKYFHAQPIAKISFKRGKTQVLQVFAGHPQDFVFGQAFFVRLPQGVRKMVNKFFSLVDN